MLKVMSFNIRYGAAPDGESSWRFRRDPLIRRINELAPDLIALQECRADGQYQDVQAGLPDYLSYGVPRGGDHESAPEMTPVFYRKDGFQFIDQGVFWLSSTPEVPGSLSWGAALPRTMAWVSLRRGEQQIWFASAHFDHVSWHARNRSAELIETKLAQRSTGEIRILAGDFNATKRSRAYQVLTRTLADPFRRAGRSASATQGSFHDFGRLPVALPIDWVLVSPECNVLDARVDTHRPEGMFLSDHDPLIVQLSF